ncbi:hypothetical protein ADL26_13480, partial [Thermoactinomyces vulgaris]
HEGPHGVLELQGLADEEVDLLVAVDALAGEDRALEVVHVVGEVLHRAVVLLDDRVEQRVDDPGQALGAEAGVLGEAAANGGNGIDDAAADGDERAAVGIEGEVAGLDLLGRLEVPDGLDEDEHRALDGLDLGAVVGLVRG